MDKQYNTINKRDHDPRPRAPHESHESYMLVRVTNRVYLSQLGTATYIVGWDITQAQ
jgi:hypothetical protein